MTPTARLYYDDPYLTSFRAHVTEAREDGRRVYLDRTAFYPESGGQPSDRGTLNGIPVLDLVDEEDRVAHLLAHPLAADDVEGVIEWKCRFDHMQQHSGQHLLSAVFDEMFTYRTVSFHLGEAVSTIDLEVAAIPRERIAAAEVRANELVCANRPLRVTYEDAAAAQDLRKPSDRPGTLRIVSIEGCDRSACGGTHVRSTGEIGAVLLRKTEKIRNLVRVEFVCGARAIARARADFDALGAIALSLSSSLDEAPALVASQQSRLAAAEKMRRRLAGELALRRGRELYASTAAAHGGYRVHQTQAVSLDDEVRQEATGFIEGSRAVYLAWSEQPAAVLFAVSPDSGLDAGKLMKAALAGTGGRGGGSTSLAQASTPTSDSLATLRAALLGSLPV